MLNFLAPYKKFLIIFSILSIIIYFGIYTLLSPEKMLPIYSPRDINPELVDSTVQHIGNDHKIADFAFTNQNGKIITQKDYENTIYVADFFFTTCPTICPKMTDNMVWLQNQLKNNPKVKLLSFSVTPDIDTPEVLKKYALQELEKIKEDSIVYEEAKRLKEFLGFFREVDKNIVPPNSILREFIGGSIFYKY